MAPKQKKKRAGWTATSTSHPPPHQRHDVLLQLLHAEARQVGEEGDLRSGGFASYPTAGLGRGHQMPFNYHEEKNIKKQHLKKKKEQTSWRWSLITPNCWQFMFNQLSDLCVVLWAVRSDAGLVALRHVLLPNLEMPWYGPWNCWHIGFLGSFFSRGSIWKPIVFLDVRLECSFLKDFYSLILIIGFLQETLPTASSSVCPFPPWPLVGYPFLQNFLSAAFTWWTMMDPREAPNFNEKWRSTLFWAGRPACTSCHSWDRLDNMQLILTVFTKNAVSKEPGSSWRISRNRDWKTTHLVSHQKHSKSIRATWSRQFPRWTCWRRYWSAWRHNLKAGASCASNSLRNHQLYRCCRPYFGLQFVYL